MLLLKNDAYSTLAVALSAQDTSLSVTAGTGDRFPVIGGADFTYLTLQNDVGKKERVKVVARAAGDDIMTIVRAQDDSAPLAWAVGDLIELRLSAAVVAPLQALEGAATSDSILDNLGFGIFGKALAAISTAALGRTAMDVNSKAEVSSAISSAITGLSQSLTVAFNAAIAARAQLLYPVGSLYINVSDNTNPATLLGFGTWTAFGAGRVLVGFDSTNALFDTAGKTGGSADATLPSHTHTATVTDPGHNHTYSAHLGTSASGPVSLDDRMPLTPSNTSTATTGITVANGTTGSSGTNANYQPYITVYMWKRTA
jgi:hypothetical protein